MFTVEVRDHLDGAPLSTCMALLYTKYNLSDLLSLPYILDSLLRLLERLHGVNDIVKADLRSAESVTKVIHVLL